MQKQLLFSLIIVISMQQYGRAQIKETDVFLKEVFASIKTQDEARFVKLYPGTEEFKKILLTMMKAESGNDTASINKGMAMFGEITDSSLYKQFAVEFKKAMQFGDSLKLDWKDAVYTSYTADTVDANELNGRQLVGKIYFSSLGKTYMLAFDEVLWLEGNTGWYGVSIKSIDEESGSNANAIIDAAVDSVKNAIDAAAQKAARKTSSNKNTSLPQPKKANLKSPAKKPE